MWGREQIWAVGKAKQFDIWSVEDKNIICAKKKKNSIVRFFFFFFLDHCGVKSCCSAIFMWEFCFMFELKMQWDMREKKGFY